jgi:hypothetical protein
VKPVDVLIEIGPSDALACPDRPNLGKSLALCETAPQYIAAREARA